MSPWLTIPLKLVTYFLNGLAIKLLWQWFVAETFYFPEMSFLQATGIGILVRFISDQYIPRDGEDRKYYLIHVFSGPLVALLIGFVIHRCI